MVGLSNCIHEFTGNRACNRHHTWQCMNDGIHSDSKKMTPRSSCEHVGEGVNVHLLNYVFRMFPYNISICGHVTMETYRMNNSIYIPFLMVYFSGCFFSHGFWWLAPKALENQLEKYSKPKN